MVVQRSFLMYDSFFLPNIYLFVIYFREAIISYKNYFYSFLTISSYCITSGLLLMVGAIKPDHD